MLHMNRENKGMQPDRIPIVEAWKLDTGPPFLRLQLDF